MLVGVTWVRSNQVERLGQAADSMCDLGDFYKSQYEANTEKMAARGEELGNAAERLSSWAQRKVHPSVDVCVSFERFDSLVTSYFYDITRYKHYHGMLDEGRKSRVNFQKIYAYTTKWILKEKPLYASIEDLGSLLKASPTAAEEYIYFANVVNELWAIYWIESSYQVHTKERLGLYSDDMPDGFLYVLKHRDFSVDWFEELLNSKFNHEIFEQL